MFDQLPKIACVICATPESAVRGGGSYRVECRRCGKFAISEEPIEDHQRELGLSAARDALSHAIRNLTSRYRGHLPISADVFERLLQDVRIRRPTEQADNLVKSLGGRNPNAPLDLNIPLDELASIVGARSDAAELQELLIEMQNAGWIDDPYLTSGGITSTARLRLTFRGWGRYDELARAAKDARKAFMAMAFSRGDGLPEAYRDCFKPAVADAGFHLERLDEGQGAGLIDDQLRVAIRTARFLIADLTTRNRGAYWEAGFAEGLGKPVIYVCSKAMWESENPQDRPHFDTNHLVTVIWSPDALDDARRRLTAAIRNTFPAEAKMED